MKPGNRHGIATPKRRDSCTVLILAEAYDSERISFGYNT